MNDDPYSKAFPYMKDWRRIWAVEESGDKELGQRMRDHLRQYGSLPETLTTDGSKDD